MDNKAIAGILYETADLLEIDGQDSFRIRSYRNAAQAIEALPQQISELIDEPKKILEIPGIGKGMLTNMQEMFKEGRLSLHAELLKKYRPSMLDLLKVQGLGPKTIALIWSAYQVCDLEGVEKLAREGKIRILPRMGEKHEAKLLKAIEDYRRIAGRFRLCHAIFHRIESPQRGSAAARSQDGLHAQRIQPGAARRSKSRGRKNRTGDLRKAEARLHPSRTARESGRNRCRREAFLAGADFSGRSPGRHPHAHCRNRRPQHH